MTRIDQAKLDHILARIENLQHTTKDLEAKDRLQVAKSELLRIKYK